MKHQTEAARRVSDARESLPKDIRDLLDNADAVNADGDYLPESKSFGFQDRRFDYSQFTLTSGQKQTLRRVDRRRRLYRTLGALSNWARSR